MKRTATVLIVAALLFVTGAALAQDDAKRFGKVILKLQNDPFTDESSELIALPENENFERAVLFWTDGEIIRVTYTPGLFILENSPSIKYRINKQDPVSLTGFVSDDRTMAINSNPDEAIKFLRDLIADDEYGKSRVAAMIEGMADSVILLDFHGIAKAVQASTLFKAYIENTGP